jgi:hypothetical protein
MSFPDSLRQETVRPTFTLAYVIAPAESFVVVNNRARPMADDNRTAIYKELNHDLIFLLRARTRSDFKAAFAGNDNVDVELPEFTTTLAVDPGTGRVVSQTYKGRGPGGVLGQIVINYSDYRTVEGLSLPFKTTATFNGEPFPALSGTVEALTVNGQIDPASFNKPKE